MKKAYVNCRIVIAHPKDKDDSKGYEIEFPGGYTTWCPKDIFEENYRLIHPDEKDLINSVEE